MRVAVVSCWKYRDAWGPFFALFRKFWPEATPWLVTDAARIDMGDEAELIPGWVNEVHFSGNWAEVVASLADTFTEAPILLLQEDFFLNAPVRDDLIDHAVRLMDRDNVGAVRLYPCPGANEEMGDPYFGRVTRHTAYRNSLQATIWRPGYLRALALRCNTPSEFELQGSAWASAHLSAEVLAFKRDVQPWPLSYYCSAISRGRWEPDALEFCRQQGIAVDTSMREISNDRLNVAVL